MEEHISTGGSPLCTCHEHSQAQEGMVRVHKYIYNFLCLHPQICTLLVALRGYEQFPLLL